MADYQPINLSQHCNVGPEFYGERKPPVGTQSFHGLPFQIGPAEGGDTPCLIGFDAGQSQPVTIPIGAAARRVIFAHTLLETQLGKGDHVCLLYTSPSPRD